MKIICVIILFVFIIFLIFQGLNPKARFASWRMFTKCPRAFFNMNHNGKSIEIWDVFPHSNLAINYNTIFLILHFLKKDYPNLSGSITLFEYPLVLKIKIEQCEVIQVRRRHVRLYN